MALLGQNVLFTAGRVSLSTRALALCDEIPIPYVVGVSMCDSIFAKKDFIREQHT